MPRKNREPVTWTKAPSFDGATQLPAEDLLPVRIQHGPNLGDKGRGSHLGEGRRPGDADSGDHRRGQW